jgi:hypothetical protein
MIPKNNSKNTIFDVAVIGAGPAGLMAAARAAELGARVVLLEKNDSAGKKLLLTGNGRCNLTNAEFDLRRLVAHYGKNGDFLFHAFSVFGPKETVSFFEKLGVKTKIEEAGRVFPKSDRSADVLKALMDYAEENKVIIRYNSRVAGIDRQGEAIDKLVLDGGNTIEAKNYIFCTGGRSYPSTGSAGDGFEWAKSLGHNIVQPSPALVPVAIRDEWAKELQGTVLKNVGVNVYQNSKKIFSREGDCLFTHFGLSGPAVINMSKRIGELLKKGGVKIVIDLNPGLDLSRLEKAIQDNFQRNPKRSLANCLEIFAPRRLVFAIVRSARLDPDSRAGAATREQRQILAKLLNRLEITAERLLGFDEAMATSGGISLKEIDGKTMRSKIIGNLFFAGEIIDIDGETGGFNLQNCWSTGRLAGEGAARG